jgi:hypothetical protein
MRAGSLTKWRRRFLRSRVERFLWNLFYPSLSTAHRRRSDKNFPRLLRKAYIPLMLRQFSQQSILLDALEREERAAPQPDA